MTACGNAAAVSWPDSRVSLSRYQKEFKNQPRALEMLFGLVTDLFVDRQKFKGHDVRKHCVAHLCCCCALS